MRNIYSPPSLVKKVSFINEYCFSQNAHFKKLSITIFKISISLTYHYKLCQYFLSSRLIQALLCEVGSCCQNLRKKTKYLFCNFKKVLKKKFIPLETRFKGGGGIFLMFNSNPIIVF